MQPLNPSTITLLVLAPLLAWRIYARFRRMVRRQQLSRVRPWITLIILPTIVLLLAYPAYAHFERLLWLAGGLMVGSLLGVYGLRHTRFESTPQGLFYTPHTYLGIALSLGNWLSVLIAVGCAFPAYAYRAHVEEQALLTSLGAPYARFMATRKRLIPFVY